MSGLRFPIKKRREEVIKFYKEKADYRTNFSSMAQMVSFRPKFKPEKR